MALGRTGANAIAYTPFNKTSFGYPNNQVQTDHSSLTNAKVVINAIAGNWGDTGHISTPSSGSAVSFYNKTKKEWICEGPVADVDAVLDVLDFFPADYSQIRNWSATVLKPNATNGSYIQENPADVYPIPDTTMFISVYDPDNNYSTESEEAVTFIATQPTFGKQRPYWSVEPATEDLSTTAHGESTGGLIDLGTILQGSDTDNLHLQGEFRHFETSNPYTGTAYGSFTDESKLFISDKKPADLTSSSKKLDFTGSKAELQAYLDNIRYARFGNDDAFDIYLTVSNGQVGSYLTKTCYFSDAPFTVSTFPDQVGAVEETTFTFSLPTLTFADTPAEINQYSYTMTFDATGIDGIDTISGGALAGTGIYTSANFSSIELMRANIDALQLTFRDDFNDNFTFTITYTGSNSTVGSTYATASQSVAVTVTGANEIDNLVTTHSWTEDTSYNLSTGTVVQIAHGYNRNFECRLLLNDTNAGVLSATASGSGTATWTSPNLLFVGTRDEVNTMLATTKFTPNPDYATNFTLGYYQKRVSGDTTSNSGNGDFYNIEIGSSTAVTLNVTAHDEFSISQVTNLAWSEDVSKIFNSGLQITDLADINSDLATYQTDYRVEIAMWYGASEFTDGTIVANTTTGLTVGGAGNQNGQGDTNMISYTGSKTNINAALADLKFIPNVDYSGNGPNVFYKIVRVQDSSVLTDQASTTRTEFATATAHNEYSHTLIQDIAWDEDTPKLFDTNAQITDLADENSDYSQHNSSYTASLQLLNWDDSAVITTASIGVLSTITGYSNLTITTNSNGTTVSGPKTDVNTALQNLKMIPDMDWISSPSTNGKFFSWIDLTRDSDPVVLVDGSASNVWVGFDEGTDSTEYATSVSGMTYTEDLQSQSIFSGTTIGITDAAADYFSNLTYEITVTIPSAAGTFDTNSSNTITLGGSANISANTKASVNTALRALQFTPTVDYATNFNVTYSQTRYINGASATTHATTQNVGTVTATPVAEFAFGTANSNIQYMVQDGAVATTGGQVLSPKNLTENWSKTYDRPITITDIAVDGGTTNYKIVFTVPAGTTLYDNTNTSFAGTLDWDTKENIHTKLSEGIRISGATANLSLSWTLYRKLGTNVEDTLGTGTLSYTYLPNPNIQSYSSAAAGSHWSTFNLSSGDSVYGISAYTSGVNYEGDIELISDLSDDICTDLDVVATSSYWTKVKMVVSNKRYFRIAILDLPSATVTNTNANLTTAYGTTVTVNLNINQTKSHTTPTEVDVYPPSTDATLIMQSNYWDGTYMNLSQRAVDLSGNVLSIGDVRSNRMTTNFSSGTGYWYDGYERAVVNGPRSNYFYGFQTEWSSTSPGDVKIVTVVKDSPTGSVQSGIGPFTIKTGYTASGNARDVYIQQVIHSGNDIYVLAMLEVGLAAKYAIISKLNWSGSAYSWTKIKEIQLGTSTDYWATEAYLSTNLESLVTVQHQYTSSFYSTTNSTFRLRVYDKDTGGTDNWGLTTTQNWTPSGSPSSDSATQRLRGFRDVNWCAFDGSDTIITLGGHHVFKRNQGGTNNWGEVTTYTDITDEAGGGMYKFTQNYLVRAVVDGPEHLIQIYDKTNLTKLSSTNSVTDATYSTAFIEMMETSLSHDVVGCYVLTDTTNGSEEITFKLYQLTT